MMQRLFFNRIDAESARSPVGRENNLILLPATNKTESLLSFLQFAIPRTEVALDASVVEQMLVFRRDDRGRFHIGFLAIMTKYEHYTK